MIRSNRNRLRHRAAVRAVVLPALPDGRPYDDGKDCYAEIEAMLPRWLYRTYFLHMDQHPRRWIKEEREERRNRKAFCRREGITLDELCRRECAEEIEGEIRFGIECDIYAEARRQAAEDEHERDLAYAEREMEERHAYERRQFELYGDERY